MIHRTITATAIVAALAITACSNGDDEFLQPGDIEDPDANATVRPGTTRAPDDDSDGDSNGDPHDGITAGAPDYCFTLAEMEVASVDDTERALGLLRELFEGLAADGPEEYRDDMARYADDTRAVQELDLDRIEADPFDLDEEETEVVIRFGVANEQFDALSEPMLAAWRDDCGDELVDGFGDEVPIGGRRQTASPGLDDIDRDTLSPEAQRVFDEYEADRVAAAVVPFRDDVTGPFGAAEFVNTTFAIAEVVWSNRPPEQFLRPDLEPFKSDEDRRFAYLTIDLTNNDPNDPIAVRSEHLALIVDDGAPIGAVEALEGPGSSRELSPLTSETRTFGFEVGDVFDAASMTLRYADDSIPGFVPVAASEPPAAMPYPIEIDPPAPGEYVGSNDISCDIAWTWTVDEAAISIDLPAELDADGDARADIGRRWLRLTGSLAAGPADGNCLVGLGNVNADDFRLVVDGLASAPLAAPNALLDENESIEVDLIWEIPVDAGAVAIRGIGGDGNSFESPVTLPVLPLVQGE